MNSKVSSQSHDARMSSLRTPLGSHHVHFQTPLGQVLGQVIRMIGLGRCFGRKIGDQYYFHAFKAAGVRKR